jgi:hypothetical protein
MSTLRYLCANTPLAFAKDRVRIPQAWERLGLPGKPCKACKSPFREERNASFSVFDDGFRWHDFATGESGDVVDLIARAKGISAKEAARVLIEWAGEGDSRSPSGPSLPVKPRTQKTEAKTLPRIPELEKPSYDDLRAIKIQRQLPFIAGMEVAVNRGLLWTAKVYDQGQEWPCWVMTDDSRRNAQARRLDGQPFGPEGATFKAKTLPGCEKAWPIGAANIGDAPNVILTEGMPDALAAVSLGWYVRDGDIADLGFACVVGAAGELSPDSMTRFAGRNVRIVFDQDEAGMDAAARWGAQLREAGAHVDGFSLAGLSKQDGTPAKDLNDVTYLVSDDGDNGATFPDGLAELFDFTGKEMAS